jgi:hypothetical protein
LKSGTALMSTRKITAKFLMWSAVDARISSICRTHGEVVISHNDYKSINVCPKYAN